jgi:hypothetical protein
MSAAATAAGYLYASGRLRGRGAREQEQEQEQQQAPQPQQQPEKKPALKEIRVAVLRQREEPRSLARPAPRKTPKIEYRTRKRWTAE